MDVGGVCAFACVSINRLSIGVKAKFLFRETNMLYSISANDCMVIKIITFSVVSLSLKIRETKLNSASTISPHSTFGRGSKTISEFVK